MTHRLVTSILGLALGVGSGWAWAHHNTTARYDAEHPITIKGTIVEFRMINPHTQLDIDVEDGQGHVDQWLIEGSASSVIYRRGWRVNDLKPGDVVTVTGRPAHDGSKAMALIKLETADGKVLE